MRDIIFIVREVNSHFSIVESRKAFYDIKNAEQWCSEHVKVKKLAERMEYHRGFLYVSGGEFYGFVIETVELEDELESFESPSPEVAMEMNTDAGGL